MSMTTKLRERYSSPRSPVFGSVVTFDSSTSLGMRASDPADSEFCACCVEERGKENNAEDLEEAICS
jgi:hypothetical protein